MPVVWQSDGVHGNTVSASAPAAKGLKTRALEHVVAECIESLKIHREAGTVLGGVHLELTGMRNVTECVGGACGAHRHSRSPHGRPHSESDTIPPPQASRRTTCRGATRRTATRGSTTRRRWRRRCAWRASSRIRRHRGGGWRGNSPARAGAIPAEVLALRAPPLHCMCTSVYLLAGARRRASHSVQPALCARRAGASAAVAIRATPRIDACTYTLGARDPRRRSRDSGRLSGGYRRRRR